MLLSRVRTSNQMANIAGFSQLLWYINALCDKLVFISITPFSSREAALSAKMSFGHHFMSSVDHSTADAMKQRLPFGICQLLSGEPLPNSSLPSLAAVSPSLLVCQRGRIHSSKLNWLAFIIFTAHAPTNVCPCTRRHTDFHMCCSASICLISPHLQYVLHSGMFIFTSLQTMFQRLFYVEAVGRAVSCDCGVMSDVFIKGITD